MKHISFVALVAVLVTSVAACGKSAEEERKAKALEKLTAPYTEPIPGPVNMKPGERYFDIKPAKPSQEKKQ